MNLSILQSSYVESNSTQVPKCHLNTKSKEYYLWTKVYSQRKKVNLKVGRIYMYSKLPSLSMFSDDIEFLIYF